MNTTVPPSGTVHPFPALKPGYHLAPLSLRTPGVSEQVVFIECPDWCTEDHVENFVHFLQDVDHKGEDFSVSVPTFWHQNGPAYQWSARLASDPLAGDPKMRDAHVIVGDEASVDAYLTPDMADGLADDLVKLAAKLRESARTARLHNQFEATQAVTA